MSTFRRSAPAGTGAVARPSGPASARLGVAAPPALPTGAASRGQVSAPPSAASSGIIPGTRRWIDGQLLVSTGHKEIDSIVGGGVAVGSLILLEQDFTHTHADTLAQLFLAEGVATGQALTVVARDVSRAAGFVDALPLNVSRDSQDFAALKADSASTAASVGVAASTTATSGGSPATSGSGNDSDEEADAEDGEQRWDRSGEGLKLAHGYKKYLQGGTGGTGASSSVSAAAASAAGRTSVRFCHSFDLNGRMTAALLQAARIVVMHAQSGVDAVHSNALAAGAGGLVVAGARVNALPAVSRLWVQQRHPPVSGEAPTSLLSASEDPLRRRSFRFGSASGIASGIGGTAGAGVGSSAAHGSASAIYDGLLASLADRLRGWASSSFPSATATAATASASATAAPHSGRATSASDSSSSESSGAGASSGGASAEKVSPVHRIVLLGLGEPGWPGYSPSGMSSSSMTPGVGHGAHGHGYGPDALDSADAGLASCSAMLQAVHALRGIVKGSVQYPPPRHAVSSSAAGTTAVSGAAAGAALAGSSAATTAPAVPPLRLRSGSGSSDSSTAAIGLVEGGTNARSHPSAAAAVPSGALAIPLTGDASQPPLGGAVLLVTAALHHLPLAAAARIRSLFDIVLKVHAFTDPPIALAAPSRPRAGAAGAGGAGAPSAAVTAGTAPEFADFHGLLLVRRALRPGAVTSVPADTLTYCFKRDRRKLSIEKPHLPPEDDRTATAPVSAGGTGTASTAGLGAAARMARGMAASGFGGINSGGSSTSNLDAIFGGGLSTGAGAGAASVTTVMTDSDGSRHAVTVESDELDAALPSAADIAALTGGGGRGGGGGGSGSCGMGTSRGSNPLDF